MATRYYISVQPRNVNSDIRPLLDAMTNYSHEIRLDNNETYRITIQPNAIPAVDYTDAMMRENGFNFKVVSYLSENVVPQIVHSAIAACHELSGVAVEDTKVVSVSAGAVEHVGGPFMAQ